MGDILKVQGIYANGYGILSKMVMRDKRLHIIARAIYSYIATYAGAGETAFPGRDLICKDLGINKNTYTKYLGQLKDYDYIRIEQSVGEKGTFGNNIFTIVSVPVFPENEIHPNWQKEKAKLNYNTVSQEIGHGDTIEEDIQPCPNSPYTVKWDTNNNNIFNNNNINNNIDTNTNSVNIGDSENGSVVVVKNAQQDQPGYKNETAQPESNGEAVFSLSEELKARMAALDESLLSPAWLEIIKDYNCHQIEKALEVVSQQKAVKNVGGLFRAALEEGWQPGKEIKKSIRAGPKQVDKDKYKDFYLS